MFSDAVPQDEAQRLALLQATRLLDGEPLAAAQPLVRLLQQTTGCDAASLHLVDAHRLVTIAQIGPWPRVQSRDGTLCDWVVRQRQGVILEDLSTHPLAGDSPWRSCMATPLLVEGHVLGVLCAVREQAGPWTEAQQAGLRDVGEAVVALMQGQLQSQRSLLMEDRVRMASLAGSDWLWETDAQGRLQWVTAGLAQHMGIDPATEIGIVGVGLYRPRDDEHRASWDRFIQARERREPFTDAVAERDTPRGTIAVSISGLPMFNARGEFQGYRGASRIVTRQLRTEQEARRANQWLREAFDAFPLSVMISDPQGRILLGNRQWWRQVGPEHELQPPSWPEMLRMLVNQGVYPDAVGNEEGFIRWRLDRYRHDVPHELRFREQWLLVRDHQLPDGCIVHFSIDITSAKQDAAKLAAQQRALADTQARLGAVLKSLPDLWFVLDERGHHVAGHEHHPMLVQPLEQLHGRMLGSNLPQPAAGLQQDALARVQATGHPQRVEYDLVTADGQQRYFEARLTRMPEGHTLFLTRDMTERHRAAEKLRVSEELYRSVAATISDGLMIVELDGRVVALNPAASRILGLAHEVLGPHTHHQDLGISWLDGSLSAPLPDEASPLTAMLAGRIQVADAIHPMRRADGETVWVQVSSHVLRIDADAPPFAVMATLRDITRELQAQQALQQSEERWKFALEGAGDGVWDWHIGSDQVYFSPRWKAQLGYDDQELPNTREAFLAMVHPREKKQVIEGLAQVAASADNLHQAEFRLRHREGHYLDILSRGRVVQRDRQGRAERMVGTHSDITRLKAAERAMVEKEAAEQASAAKTEFLSRMSHEMRTPLNAILGFSQLLHLQYLQAAPHTAPEVDQVRTAQNYLHHILHASRHLMGLVNDVLDLHKVESGVLNFRPEPVDLRDELGLCLDMLSQQAERHQVSLHNHLDEPWPLVVDRQRLRQVIMNLASNAIKYNQSGGRVDLQVAALPDGQHLMLTIADTGVGMDERELGRLFQPFERLGRETSSTEGTGLGLIITRSLVEAMGGDLTLHSAPGAGTRACVTLPRSAPTQASDTSSPAPDKALPPDVGPATDTMHACDPNAMRDGLNPAQADDAPAGPPQRALKVLYVEDNRINAMLFEEALRPFEQIQLSIAEDGQQAMEMVQSDAPDVLVLDAHLPGMTGFDVLAALRRVPGLAKVPAYMCSADAMPDDVARAEAAGFAGYWSKPIDIVAVTDELCRLASALPA